ncbi:MAG: hypothetical protein A2V77_18140 [Anaeromyxobacter sp. RBG_16_69_14]|nr:MAG: hypothetical protein A2V77_18140 [Anaeromyxobacter sp. RBG_16_69_14]
MRLEIVEEHLDEAAFLYRQWESALRSPTESLEGVARGPEEVLLAHLDALAAAGGLAADHLLVPALAGDDEGKAFAAAFVLAARAEGLPLVLEALAEAAPPVRAAMERALQVLPAPDLGAQLRAQLEKAAPVARLAIAGALIARREDPGTAVRAWIDSAETAGAVLGLRAMLVLGKGSEAHRVAGLIRSREPQIWAAAMEIGVIMGLREAWSACERAVAERGAEFAVAARLRALSGDAEAVKPLLEASADARLARRAVLALGLTGRVAAADALLELMGGSLGGLAGEAFCAITGLRMEGAYVAEEAPEREEPIPFEEEDLEADLVPGPEARLPLPDGEAVARWWRGGGKGSERGERRRFDSGRRYLRGRPFTCGALLEEIASGPMRRREALALELAIRTRGQAQIDVFALSARQRAELESARGAIGRAWAVRFHDLPAPWEVRIRPAAAATRAVPRAAHAADTRDVVVSGIGLATPLGDAAQSFAAVRAGIGRFFARPDLYTCLGQDGRPDRDDPVVASGFPDEEAGPRDGNRPAEWLACIAGQALRDAKESARLDAGKQGRLGLFLSMPSGRPGFSEEQSAAISRHLCDRDERGPVERERIVLGGHASVLALCEEACAALRKGEIEVAIVGGADSYLFREWLAPLDRERRLKCGRVPDGFRPGEAAGLIVLELRARAAKRGVQPWATVRATAARQASGATGRQPAPGAALAGVVEELTAAAPAPPIVVADLNGERWRMKEWGYALARLGSRLPAPLALEHPALQLGDVGAASAGVLVALAVQFLAKKYPDRGSAIVWAASEDGDRRGLLLEQV